MHHMNCSRTPIKSISKCLLSPHRRGPPVCGSSNMSMIRSLASFYRRKVYLLGQHGPRSHGIIVRHTQGPATLNRERRNHCTKMYVHSESSTDADVRQTSSHRPPPRSPLSTWARWVLGSMLTLILPFWEKKWRTLLRIEGEVEMVTDAVEEVFEVVEKVATVVEKVSSEVAERLPEEGKLKDAVLSVEHVSREAAEDAHLAKDIIHKLDEVKQEVELILESVVDAGKKVDGKK
ncbi:unnamed protein product [Musa acuminata subsp. malaccensis]|uniref:(wild Malaysian banana) hypothetical protein n=1 Tax=Musa acuminata subsp. malaccensis TaxID=214687 RepID=A0A804HU72_MUSAM|nr:PREDICTED: uncharacterized protein LOC103991621 [Musa acuminata subsp. malaccensis]CAG1859554.1 unnamed protein product [Musa acuminata subsp. malaccensis]